MDQISSSDRVLLTAFREIGQMADRLNLPKMIAVSVVVLEGASLRIASCWPVYAGQLQRG